MTPTKILHGSELHRVEGNARQAWAYHLNYAVRGLLRVVPNDEAPEHNPLKS